MAGAVETLTSAGITALPVGSDRVVVVHGERAEVFGRQRLQFLLDALTTDQEVEPEAPEPVEAVPDRKAPARKTGSRRANPVPPKQLARVKALVIDHGMGVAAASRKVGVPVSQVYPVSRREGWRKGRKTKTRTPKAESPAPVRRCGGCGGHTTSPELCEHCGADL